MPQINNNRIIFSIFSRILLDNLWKCKKIHNILSLFWKWIWHAWGTFWCYLFITISIPSPHRFSSHAGFTQVNSPSKIISRLPTVISLLFIRKTPRRKFVHSPCAPARLLLGRGWGRITRRAWSNAQNVVERGKNNSSRLIPAEARYSAGVAFSERSQPIMSMNFITCPSCHEENPADRRECLKCGADLKKPPLRIASSHSAPSYGRSVVIEDIDIPFGSMVLFMIKWSFASIPAAIVIGIFWWIVVTIFGRMLFSMFWHTSFESADHDIDEGFDPNQDINTPLTN